MERIFKIGDIVVPTRHIREELVSGSMFEDINMLGGKVVAIHEYASGEITIDVDTYDEDGESATTTFRQDEVVCKENARNYIIGYLENIINLQVKSTEKSK